jgi:hypothetical protein
MLFHDAMLSNVTTSPMKHLGLFHRENGSGRYGEVKTRLIRTRELNVLDTNITKLSRLWALLKCWLRSKIKRMADKE